MRYINVFIVMIPLVWAQSAVAFSTSIRSENPSSEERDPTFAPYPERWKQWSIDKHQRPRRGSEQLTQEAPDAHDRTIDRRHRWQTMAPEERDRIRRQHNQFRKLPSEEQDRIRKNFQWYQTLPLDERRALQDRWRRSQLRSGQEQPGKPSSDSRPGGTERAWRSD